LSDDWQINVKEQPTAWDEFSTQLAISTRHTKSCHCHWNCVAATSTWIFNMQRSRIRTVIKTSDDNAVVNGFLASLSTCYQPRLIALIAHASHALSYANYNFQIHFLSPLLTCTINLDNMHWCLMRWLDKKQNCFQISSTLPVFGMWACCG